MPGEERKELRPQSANMLTAQSREEVEAHAQYHTSLALGLTPDAIHVFISDEERKNYQDVYNAQIRVSALMSTRVQELFPEITAEIPTDQKEYAAYFDKQNSAIPSQPKKIIEKVYPDVIGALAKHRFQTSDPVRRTVTTAPTPKSRPRTPTTRGEESYIIDPRNSLTYRDEHGEKMELQPGEWIDKRRRVHFNDGSVLDGTYTFTPNKPKSY